MMLNYFRNANRILISQKFYSLINIIGLSIGITSCILVALYVKQTLSYDRFNKNAEQIYRISFSYKQEGVTETNAQSQAQLGPTLKNQYPEIKKLSRIYFEERSLVKAGDINNFEEKIAFADSSFFEIFTFKAVAGYMSKFLKKPNTVIITESTARKYFGAGNPLGSVITVNNKYDYEVSGVIEDVPVTSHFRFDFIIPYSALGNHPVANYFSQWGATFGSYTYMLAEKGFDQKAFEKKTENFFASYSDVKEADFKVVLTPLLKIHLCSHLADEAEQNSSISKIIISSSIALFILLLACINFVNLSTARSSNRSMEIGIRKVAGAARFQLIQQFLGESVLLALASFLISLLTFLFIQPVFSSLLGVQIIFDLNNNWGIWLLFMAGAFIIGILAGLYPALFLSSYKPVNSLKGINSLADDRKSSPFLRKSLVVFQFCISIVFIVGTITVNLQLKYLRGYNMGFDKKHMIILPAHEKVSGNYNTIKSELGNIPGVLSVTAGTGAPTGSNNIGTVCKPNGINSDIGSFSIEVNSVDNDYMKHFGVKLVAGRSFSEEFRNDFPNAMVINEKMASKLGFKNPQDAIGKSYIISLNDFKPEIIGVVKDFNSNSLHNEITAQAFMINPNWFQEFIVKVNPDKMPEVLNNIKVTWTKFFPQYPFEYHFLDESINNMYKSEEKYSMVISSFSVIALLVACLGLLGLATFVTEQRKKEIGIRKVQGASVSSVVLLISGNFVILVITANLFAWPLAYFFMKQWLFSFVYRIDFSIWTLIASGILAFLIATFTVAITGVKAAVANPVESLR